MDLAAPYITVEISKKFEIYENPSETEACSKKNQEHLELKPKRRSTMSTLAITTLGLIATYFATKRIRSTTTLAILGLGAMALLEIWNL
ncbi:hypothetical protein D3C76_1270570 [compost metagenome]